MKDSKNVFDLALLNRVLAKEGNFSKAVSAVLRALGAKHIGCNKNGTKLIKPITG